MKLLGIARFELAYQLGRGWSWLLFVALVAFSFLVARDGSLSVALYEDFFINAPFAIAKTTVAGGLIWLLAAAAIAGEAAARDVTTGLHPLAYTSSVSEAEYLGGRFLAALAINAWTLIAVQIGILLGVYLPGVDPVLIGPFRPEAYLTAYAYIALPNAFVATAIQFSLAAHSGRPIAAYFGSFLLFFTAFFVASLLLFGRGLGALLDPIGVRFILEDLSRLWTTTEKSWRLLALEGTVLENRLLWIGVALATLALTFWRFRFAHRPQRDVLAWLRQVRGRSTGIADAVPSRCHAIVRRVDVEVPRITRTFDLVMHVRQTLAIARTSFRAMATSWSGVAMLIGVPLMTVPVVLDQMVSGGAALVPATVLVLGELTAPLSAELSRWVIIPLLVIFFAGELVWRERDVGLGEITGALPGSEWAPLLGTFLGLGLVLAVFMALQTMAGVVAQAVLGYRNFEVWLYLTILFGLQFPEYLLFAMLALVVHVVVNGKYTGHLVAIAAYVVIAMAPMFGIEHNLLIYGVSPAWSYTEMRGFGASVGPWLWFTAYWAAWASLMTVLARLLWVRGTDSSAGARLARARARVTRATAWTASAAGAAIVLLGGVIFYNTNVLNEYVNASRRSARSASYEERYGRYAALPQPQLTSTRLHIEIDPARRAADIRGTYHLRNAGTTRIDAVHVATAANVVTSGLVFDRPATLTLADEERHYRIYDLERPLESGESLQLEFQVQVIPRGFREDGVDESIAANGTFFTTQQWLPAIGYQRSRELTSAADRRAHGLPPRALIPSLDDLEALQVRAGGGTLEAVIGTAADQTAVAPGVLRRAWMEGQRRYFHYVSDGPIGSEHAIASARYAVHETRWHDVAIRIVHHPSHAANIERMVRSITASLSYYTTQFGPYRHNHLTFVERPGNGTGMHADPSLISFTEGAALWRSDDDPASLDLPFAVVAHEMAHQWTVPYAAVEGAPVMSESVAWYYALQVVREARGEAALRRLLAFMRQPSPYAPIRRGEPLLRGLDPYLAYRKGPFALYTLGEYIGVARVNAALRRLLERHRPADAPLATTRDLYRELEAVTPAAVRPLLHELFAVNASWELATDSATATRNEDGTWQVTLSVRARKVVADASGAETEVPMADAVEVGIFDDSGLNEPIYLRQHPITGGQQRITIAVPRQPTLAGIDPRFLLVDWEHDDNVAPVTMQP